MVHTLATSIFEYSERVMGKQLPKSVSDELKKRIVDSIFVSYGARDAPPVKIAKRALMPSSGKYNAGIYFSDKSSSVDVSTFINGCMTRYLDYNDTYLTKKEFAHPSDNIPPILALTHALGAKGKDALRAIYLGYQVQCSFADAASLRNNGWDHVVYLTISSAAGSAAMLGLKEGHFIHAINLGVSNSISMRQVRAGELSMWKGCTAANATRNGVLAALLAKEGLTGPAPIFEGEMGFFKQVTGKFAPNLLRDRVCRTLIKNHPVEYNAMSGVDAALELRQKIDGDVKKINVDTATVIYRTIAKDPEKLRPTTRETADHSLPYIIAYTLVHGAPNPHSYDEKYLKDRKILGLVDKMELRITKEFDAMYPDYVPSKIEAVTNTGKFSAKVTIPKGHYRNPYSWEDIRRKGITLLKDNDKVDAIIDFCRRMERKDMSELFWILANIN